LPTAILFTAVVIGMGFWFNAIMRVDPLMSSNPGAVQALACCRWYVYAMAICGVWILLLATLT
jgi:hypothetical protein